jgi:hypothetical protein
MQMPAHFVPSKYLHFCTITCHLTPTYSCYVWFVNTFRTPQKFQNSQYNFHSAEYELKVYNITHPTQEQWSISKLDFIQLTGPHQPLGCCLRHSCYLLWSTLSQVLGEEIRISKCKCHWLKKGDNELQLNKNYTIWTKTWIIRFSKMRSQSSEETITYMGNPAKESPKRE